jgi:hypothetical protein
MSTTIFPGRYAARSDSDFVLFRIGMRFNGRRGIGAALKTFFTLMPAMLAEQQAQPEIGMLSTSIALSWPVIQMTQFWRSFDDLERYATAPDGRHTNAWRWFNKLGRANEGTGVWHETYRIAPGSFEAIYVNMPRYGLAAAVEHAPVMRGADRARDRMNAPAARTAS